LISPRQRYENDPIYNSVVNTLETIIEACQLTPLEVREAAMLACIHYEQRRTRHSVTQALAMPSEAGDKVLAALETLKAFVDGEELHGKEQG